MEQLDYQVLCYIPLATGIVFGLYNHKNLALTALSLAMLCALLTGVITAVSFGYALAGLFLSNSIAKVKYQILGYLILLIWMMPLLMHIFPNFNNPKVLDTVHSGPLSQPFSMYLNFDKALVFFALLLVYPSLCKSRGIIRWQALLLLILPSIALLLLAWWTGAIQPEFSLPNWLWLFALNNLLITCVIEEALFRGFIQHSLQRHLGFIVALLIASMLFGLAHFQGGYLLILFATLAGMIYGLAFYFSGRLWVTALAHFAFNISHLVLFTYPALAK